MKCASPKCNNEFIPYKGFQICCSTKCWKHVDYLRRKEEIMTKVLEWQKNNKGKVYHYKKSWRENNGKQYRIKNFERDKYKRRKYNVKYRIKKGLKGIKCKLYQYCSYCGYEHLRNKDNFYMTYRPSRDNDYNTPIFVCKKYVKFLNDKNHDRLLRKKYKKKYKDDAIDNLYDSYVREKLRQQGWKFINNDIISIKRVQLQGKRLIKQLQS